VSPRRISGQPCPSTGPPRRISTPVKPTDVTDGNILAPTRRISAPPKPASGPPRKISGSPCPPSVSSERISGQNPVVLCSISNFGVGMWRLDSFGGLQQQAIAEFPHYDCPRGDCPTCPQECPTVNSCYYPVGALRITTIEQYSFNHITTNPDGTTKIEPNDKESCICIRRGWRDIDL